MSVLGQFVFSSLVDFLENILSYCYFVLRVATLLVFSAYGDSVR